MNILREQLREIYLKTLWVSSAFFVFQLVVTSWAFFFPLGTLLFGLLLTFPHYILRYLTSKHSLVLSQDEFASSNRCFVFSCMKTMLVFAALELVILLPFYK